MRRLLPLLIVAGTLALGSQGCSDRAHLNPLDPSNPDTQGRPAGFVGLAGNQLVILRWAAPSGTAVRGFRLLRRAGAETEFTELATLLVPGVTGYLDPGLANGVDHAYRLQYVLQSGGLSPASETIATPGPLRPWVSDFARGQLVRITADARVSTIEPTSALQSPSDLEADTPRGRVWIADTFAGRVIGYSPATQAEIDLGGLQDPQAIAVAPDNGNVWVCDGSLNQVLLFDPNAPTAAIAVRGVTNPLSVAVDALDGSVWVCERGADRLRHLDASAQPIAAAVVSGPSRVAVDSLTRSAWVTSFPNRNVVRVSPSAQPQDTIGGFAGPIGVVVDPRRGRIWIADAAGNRIVVLDRTGAELFRVQGLSEVREIALDLATGEAWATLPGESAVARISAAGVVMSKLRGFSEPYDIVLERLP